jgi:hypothetical protein
MKPPKNMNSLPVARSLAFLLILAAMIFPSLSYAADYSRSFGTPGTTPVHSPPVPIGDHKCSIRNFPFIASHEVQWSVRPAGGVSRNVKISNVTYGLIFAELTFNWNGSRWRFESGDEFSASSITVSAVVRRSGLVEETHHWSLVGANLSINPPSWTAPPAGATQPVSVTSNVSWTVSSNQSWLRVSPTSGSNNGSFTMTADPNTSGSSRSATVTVTGGGISRPISITQAAVVLTVNPSSWAAPPAGGTQSVSVTSNVSWTVSSNQSWLRVSPTSGSNNGSFTMTADPNSTGSSRSASVTVSGGGISRTISVTQSTAVLTVNPTSWGALPAGGTQSVSVTSNVSWTVSSNQSWLRVSPTSGSNNGSFTMTADPNSTGSSRSATVTVSGGGISRTISVTQSTAVLTVNPTSWGAPPAGGTQSVSVTSNVSWTVSSNQSWLRVSPTSGSNNGSFTMTADPNSTGSSRSATVTVTGGGISRPISITQGSNSGTLSVDVFNASGSRMAAGDLSAVQVALMPGGWSNPGIVKPVTVNPVPFSGRTFGTYEVVAYAWDMVIATREISHNNTTTPVSLNARPQRPLTFEVFYSGGAHRYPSASAFLDSYDGDRGRQGLDPWIQRASGITDANGRWNLQAWPTTRAGERYRVRVRNSAGTQVAAKDDIELSDGTSGSSYIVNTTQPLPTGALSVDVFNASGSRMAAGDLSAVQVALMPGGWANPGTVKPVTVNPVPFSGRMFGTYEVVAYAWDMVIATREISHNNTTTPVILSANPLRPLTFEVFYSGGAHRYPSASVFLDSYDGDRGRQGLDPWIQRASGITDANGRWTLQAWPTTRVGERYRVRVRTSDGTQVAAKDDIELSDGTSGSSHIVTTNQSLPTGTLSVDVFNASGSRMAAGDLSGVQVALMPGGWANPSTVKPVTVTPVSFSGRTYGTYEVVAYAWDMLISSGETPHNKPTTSVSLNAKPQRPLTFEVFYSGGAHRYPSASVFLDSHDGDRARQGLDPWVQRASGSTDSNGRWTVQAWPTTQTGERYRLRVRNPVGTQVAVNDNIDLPDAATGSSYIVTTTQALPIGTLSVDVFNASGSRIAAGDLSAVQVALMPGGWSNPSTVKPVTVNPVPFSGRTYGTHEVVAYAWDMVIASGEIPHNNPTTLVSLSAKPQRPLTFEVFYSEGPHRYPAASVFLDSYDGDRARQGFDPWVQRASGSTDIHGLWTMQAWPTTKVGERYRVRVRNSAGTQVAVNDNINLSNAASGSRYEIVTSQVRPQYIVSTVSSHSNKAVSLGELIEIQISVQNPENVNRSRWIGLSFSGPISGTWPDGWYDIPGQEITLASSESKMMVFQFIVPNDIPFGNYTAHVAVWDGYDATKNLMVSPRYDYQTLSAFIVPDSFLDSLSADPYGLARHDFGGLYQSIKPAYKSGLIDFENRRDNPLVDSIFGRPLGTDNSRIIVLVHGWNPFGTNNPLQSGEWGGLSSKLREDGVLPGWSLVEYDWARDANSGFLWSHNNSNSSVSHQLNQESELRPQGLIKTVVALTATSVQMRAENFAIRAAERAYAHGILLGIQIVEQVQKENLQQVHLIGHSAGSWAVYSALRYISHHAPNCEIQVTYLDPFIPDQTSFNLLPLLRHPFSGEILNDSVNFTRVSATGAARAEAYYTQFDETELAASVGLLPSEATTVLWNWDVHENAFVKEVSFYGGLSNIWRGHGLPITFYGDSIAQPASSVFSGLGWTKSLANNSPVIAIMPSNHDFGSVQVGTTVERIFTVENRGGGTLSGSASVSGPFSIIAGGTYSVPAGESRTITVSYSPTHAGTYYGDVTFIGGGGATGAVNGTAIDQSEVATPTITPNGGSHLGSVTVTLSTTTSGTTIRYTTNGADVTPSSPVYSSPFTLNSSTTVRAKAFLTGHLDSDQASANFSVQPVTRIIGLSGDLAFGSVTVDQSAQRTITISNTGNSTLTVSGISYPAGFSGNWSDGTIATGGTRNVTVTFSPTAAQNYGGNITVNSDATSGTNTRATSGAGFATPISGLWANATRHGEWLTLPWFGWFASTTEEWVYHAEHGWLSCFGSDTESFYIYDTSLEMWGWTSELTYPWVFWFGPLDSWTYYLRGGQIGGRWFYRADVDEWREEKDLKSLLAVLEGITGLLVADRNSLSDTEREFHQMMEAGEIPVALLDAELVASDNSLDSIDVFVCFSYGGASIGQSFSDEMVSAILARVEQGARLIVNGEAGGGRFLAGAGIRSYGPHGGWFPALPDAAVITSYSDDPIFTGVEVYEGSLAANPLSYYHSGDHSWLIWRVDNTRTYTGRYGATGANLIEPDRWLYQSFGTGFQIGAIAQSGPEWDYGGGRISQLGINWTFDQANAIGGYFGTAGRRILRNIGQGHAAK